MFLCAALVAAFLSINCHPTARSGVFARFFLMSHDGRCFAVIYATGASCDLSSLAHHKTQSKGSNSKEHT